MHCEVRRSSSARSPRRAAPEAPLSPAGIKHVSKSAISTRVERYCSLTCLLTYFAYALTLPTYLLTALLLTLAVRCLLPLPSLGCEAAAQRAGEHVQQQQPAEEEA